MAGIQTTDVTTTGEGGLSAPGHGTFSYGPSKAACIHLTKMQASKLVPQNIMVNCVCPGVFPSRMTSFGVEKFKDTLLSRQPSGRIGKPSDFAGVILFLSSQGSAHMTGNVIELDGGSTLSGWRANKRSNLWVCIYTRWTYIYSFYLRRKKKPYTWQDTAQTFAERN